MKFLSKQSKSFGIFFGILIGFIVIVIGVIRQNKQLFAIFYSYKKEVNIEKNLINQNIIDGGTQSPISKKIYTSKEKTIRLEFPYDTVEKKILSLSLKGNGNIQGYLVSKEPILNCNTWAINERGGCSNFYWLFKNLRNIYGFFQKSWLVKQPIAALDDKQLLSFNDKKILSVLDTELGKYNEYSISSFIFSYMKKQTNMERFFPTMEVPNGYSIIYLNTNKENNIIFQPYDLLSKIDKIGYIISLSGGSSIEYKFIKNPLSKTDKERINN